MLQEHPCFGSRPTKPSCTCKIRGNNKATEGAEERFFENNVKKIALILKGESDDSQK